MPLFFIHFSGVGKSNPVTRLNVGTVCFCKPWIYWNISLGFNLCLCLCFVFMFVFSFFFWQCCTSALFRFEHHLISVRKSSRFRLEYLNFGRHRNAAGDVPTYQPKISSEQCTNAETPCPMSDIPSGFALTNDTKPTTHTNVDVWVVCSNIKHQRFILKIYWHSPLQRMFVCISSI